MADNVFIGCFYPRNQINEIRAWSKNGLDNAADRFQWALISGIKQIMPSFQFLSWPVLRSYPFYNRKVFPKFNKEMEDDVKFFGYINVFPFSHIHKAALILLWLMKRDFSASKKVILYGATSYGLAPCYLLKLVFRKQLKTCVIVPDVPRFMRPDSSGFISLLKRLDSFMISKMLKSMDSFVFLTEYMCAEFGVTNKPFIIIDGIYQEDLENVSFKKSEKISYLYTGSLDRRYGIENMLQAFVSLESTNSELWICGTGTRADLELLRKFQALNKSILYFGEVEKSKVFELQRQAWFLINPRREDSEYVKFSFPSKTIEYFASGTPTIMNRLSGIGKDYYEYCLIPQNDSIESLAQVFRETMSLHYSKFEELGEKARKFVLANKTARIQAEKLKILLDAL